MDEKKLNKILKIEVLCLPLEILDKLYSDLDMDAL
jgi:hypothetical protein